MLKKYNIYQCIKVILCELVLCFIQDICCACGLQVLLEVLNKVLVLFILVIQHISLLTKTHSIYQQSLEVVIIIFIVLQSSTNTYKLLNSIFFFFIYKLFTNKYVINFIQLVSLQLLDQFSQTKLYWKAPNKSYLHKYQMSKSDNRLLRYQTISNQKYLLTIIRRLVLLEKL